MQRPKRAAESCARPRKGGVAPETQDVADSVVIGDRVMRAPEERLAPSPCPGGARPAPRSSRIELERGARTVLADLTGHALEGMPSRVTECLMRSLLPEDAEPGYVDGERANPTCQRGAPGIRVDVARRGSTLARVSDALHGASLASAVRRGVTPAFFSGTARDRATSDASGAESEPRLATDGPTRSDSRRVPGARERPGDAAKSKRLRLASRRLVTEVTLADFCLST